MLSQLMKIPISKNVGLYHIPIFALMRFNSHSGTTDHWAVFSLKHVCVGLPHITQ